MRNARLWLSFLLAYCFICDSGSRQSLPVSPVRPVALVTKEHARQYLDDLIKKLKMEPALINQTRDGATPLMIAATFGLADQARALYTSKADVNIIHQASGMTALTIASAKGHEEIVLLLLAHTKERIHGFVKAAKGGHISVLRLFFPTKTSISPYVDINEKSGHDTALTAAAQAGQTESVQFLLDHGASVNAPAFNRFTPLAYSLFAERKETAQVLVDRGGTLPDISWEKKDASKVVVTAPYLRYECDEAVLVLSLIKRYQHLHKEGYVFVF